MAAGNLAGDCQDWRDAVEANGAIRPLVRLLLGPLQQAHSAPVFSASQTAAWALSNLLQGSGRQVGPLTMHTTHFLSFPDRCSFSLPSGSLELIRQV